MPYMPIQTGPAQHAPVTAAAARTVGISPKLLAALAPVLAASLEQLIERGFTKAAVGGLVVSAVGALASYLSPPGKTA